jgi:hypothetical protein
MYQKLRSKQRKCRWLNAVCLQRAVQPFSEKRQADRKMMPYAIGKHMRLSSTFLTPLTMPVAAMAVETIRYSKTTAFDLFGRLLRKKGFKVKVSSMRD